MNKVLLEGRLGKDVEVKHTQNGTMVATVTMATSNDYKDKSSGEWVKRDASWHNLVCFAPVAETLTSYKKGDKLNVSGKINYREYTDKEGTKRKTTEIQVLAINPIEQATSASQNEQDVPF